MRKVGGILAIVSIIEMIYTQHGGERTNIDTGGEFIRSSDGRGRGENREQRVPATGVPAHHSLSRTTLIAAAVSTC